MVSCSNCTNYSEKVSEQLNSRSCTVMPILYVKEPHEAVRREVEVEVVGELSVKDFKAALEEKLEIPVEEQKRSEDHLYLIYAGRMLKSGKTLGHYKIAEGCTIHLMRKKKKEEEEEAHGPLRSGFGSIISNRGVLRVIGRMLSNPTLLHAMIAGTPLANNPAIQDALTNPDLLSNLADPDAIAEYLQQNPEIAMMMEGMLRIYSLLLGGREMEPGDEGGIVDMVEGNFEDDMDAIHAENMSRLATQQEQMFEHSRALAAHQQQQQSGVPADPPSSQHPPSSQQHGSIEVLPPSSTGESITQEQLASALAGALVDTQSSSLHSPSPLPSLDFSTASTPSGPSSLQTDQPPADRSEQVGTVTQEGTITSNVLQQALVSAMGNVQRQSSQEQQLPLRDQYKAQLEQLHMMGITDDASCLHALEATDGDLQSALEILMGGGQ